MADFIACVVVTYNRKELLVECLQALRQQLRPVDRIIIVDNASTDGTRLLLAEMGILSAPDVDYIELCDNEGGAGGFYWGIRYAFDLGADWVWLMDDDVEPAPDALSVLVSHTGKPNVGYLCSCVRAGDGCTSMNMPVVDMNRGGSSYPRWDTHLDEGLVRISSATFVSVLVSRRAVAQCQFPLRRFFIWGDDLEYTRRIREAGFDAFLVGASKVLHKRAAIGELSLVTEDNQRRIAMFRFLYRNTFWTSAKYDGIEGRLKHIAGVGLVALKIIARAPDRRLKRLSVLTQGILLSYTQNLENQADWDFDSATTNIRNHHSDIAFAHDSFTAQA
ncbi:glycosyltransferase family 2 protein [Microvirga pudoricolor]|uniref:glycosyltransferase family 2 protein n=1 Tax=Microvirga pudoricolor TaxID=2778729 RepID=UPI0019507A23|nr:glycosyltransferase family 2 protein [Microvirga pudoricolor]MBM6596396.1 glycosyltransferase family 2 protein [Microvirga pudoricolor]